MFVYIDPEVGSAIRESILSGKRILGKWHSGPDISFSVDFFSHYKDDGDTVVVVVVVVASHVPVIKVFITTLSVLKQ